MTDLDRTENLAAPDDPDRNTAVRRKKRPPRREPHWPWFLAGMAFGILLIATIQSYTGLVPPWIYDRVRADLAAGRGGTVTAGSDNAAVREANARGPADAPVTVVEYSDFRCGYCRRAFATTNQQIMQTYVNTGRVRFVYKHLAILGTESVQAAVASECAADQNRFWDYHDQLFTLQSNGGTLSLDVLTQLAQQLGLDADRFNTCLRNQETLPRVQADMEEAQKYGFSGTPSYVVAGTPIVGAQPFAAFSQVIDAALK